MVRISALSRENYCRCMAVFFLCALLLLLSIFFLPFYPGGAVYPQTAAAAEGEGGADLRVLLDGVLIKFDTKPLLEDKGPMLPLRAIGEQAGFMVHWDNEIKRATLHRGGNVISLYPDNPLYAVNGILKRTEQPPQLKDSRLLVSLDFLEKGAGLALQSWDRQKGYLHLTDRQPTFPRDTAIREQPVYFVELLLPPEDRVEVDESFEMHLAAPFVQGIFAYEVLFFFNPDIIQVMDVRNPAYQQSHEYFLKEIDNTMGTVRYTLTTLGARDYLPPRHTLAVIEAVVSREGAVPLIEGTLKVTLLDNRARNMPVGLEERVLYVGPVTQ